MRMLRPDSKGRVNLGALSKGISGFSVHQERNGKIILEPFVEIPMNEKWLFENETVLNHVKKGLQQAKQAFRIEKGSFRQFIDDVE